MSSIKGNLQKQTQINCFLHPPLKLTPTLILMYISKLNMQAVIIGGVEELKNEKKKHLIQIML